MSGHPRDGGCIEQVGVEADRDGKRSGRLDDQHHQIEGRGPPFQRDQFHRKPAQIHLQPGLVLHEGRGGLFDEPVRLVEDEHGLAERRSAEVARRPQPLDQTQRRIILVFECRQYRPAHLAQQRAERRISGKIRAQDDRIGEEAHQPFEFRPAATGHGRCDEDVFLAAVAVQHRFERRQQHHVERRSLGFCERSQPPSQVFVHREIVMGAAKRLNRRPRPIGRQIEDGQRAAQLLLPIFPEPFAGRARQHVGLPPNEIRILEIEWMGARPAGRLFPPNTARPAHSGSPRATRNRPRCDE